MDDLPKKYRIGKDGLKVQTGWTLVIETDKRRDFVLSKKDGYSKGQRQQLKGVATALKEAYAQGYEVDVATLGALDQFPKLKKAILARVFPSFTRELTVGALIDEHLADCERTGADERTVRNKTNSLRRLAEYFGRGKLVDEITRADARACKAALDSLVRARNGSEATAAGYIRDIKRLFNWAIELEKLDANPFLGIKKGSFVNEEKQGRVPPELYKKLLAAAETSEERLLLVLGRIEGLRCASELTPLKWTDFHFDESKPFVRVHDMKNRRFPGKAIRMTPIFPPARPILESERALATSDFVFPTLQGKNKDGANNEARKWIERVIERANVEKYPKLLHSLRRSASNDVVRFYGAFNENRWIGHSRGTAEAHYYETLESDFTLERPKPWEGF